MKTSSMEVLIGFLLVATSPLVRAQSVEHCGDVLRYASRDVKTQVTYSDQRKYYYQRVCKDAASGIGIDYKDATAVLGLSYSSKDEYCKNEQSFDTNTSYSRIDSSYALDAYVQCRALSVKGIVTSVTMPPTDNPTVFSIGVQRISSDPQTIQTVSLDPGSVNCAVQKDGKIFNLNEVSNDISYALPESKAKWSLVCTRKSNSDADGNKTYGPVQLILTTTAGDLPFSLPGIGMASNNWASDLRNESNLISQRLDALKNELRSTSIIAQCSGDGWLPRPAAPSCPAGYVDSGQFSHSAPGGKNGFGGNCRICLSVTK
jgi:hypothetical protein